LLHTGGHQNLFPFSDLVPKDDQKIEKSSTIAATIYGMFRRQLMRALWICAVLMAAAVGLSQQAAESSGGYTLKISVSNVNQEGGNIGVLVFNSDKGWPEDRTAALKDIIVPAHPGTVVVSIPNLPAGDYAVAVLHDVNQNHKMDRNWMSKPKEQWAMSNNPHALIKAPSYSTAKFHLAGDQTIEVKLQ
jgi:uncharacterized protein (DUF2141 family)